MRSIGECIFEGQVRAANERKWVPFVYELHDTCLYKRSAGSLSLILFWIRMLSVKAEITFLNDSIVLSIESCRLAPQIRNMIRIIQKQR